MDSLRYYKSIKCCTVVQGLATTVVLQFLRSVTHFRPTLSENPTVDSERSVKIVLKPRCQLRQEAEKSAPTLRSRSGPTSKAHQRIDIRLTGARTPQPVMMYAGELPLTWLVYYLKSSFYRGCLVPDH